MLQPVILCGGSGTRLWPLSRPDRPKPFLKLLGERTLFQQTFDRMADRSRFAEPIVVAGRAHAKFVAEQGGACSVILEPDARNTAPAIALAAARLPPECVMLVCPSDHHIADEAAFLQGVTNAAALAQDGWVVCIGVKPERPETGYGYIELGNELSGGNCVRRFVEKPNEDEARSYISQVGFAWNAGIFVMRAGDYLAELERQRPDIARLVRRSVENGEEVERGFIPQADEFLAIDGESIDYAVMEGTERAAVVSIDMGWSDVGNWDALASARGVDGTNNVRPTANADLVDCNGVLVETDGPRVSAVGLRDVTIVVDGDEVLVVARGSAADVAKLGRMKGK